MSASFDRIIDGSNVNCRRIHWLSDTRHYVLEVVLETGIG